MTDLPPFTDDPVDRLRHTLAAFEGGDMDGSDWAIHATSNLVPGHQETGITWGDLWVILDRLGG